jgi:hypothetical protein
MNDQHPAFKIILSELSRYTSRTRKELRAATRLGVGTIAEACEYLVARGLAGSAVCRGGFRGAPPLEYSVDPATRRVWAEEERARREEARNILERGAS